MKPSAEPLTDRQRAVLCVIDHYRRETGLVCTVVYIAQRLSIHHSTVQEHLEAVHRKGYLRAPAPGALIREIPPPPPLPIPPRDEPDDTVDTAVPQTATASSLPALPPTVVVEKHTPLGASAPTSVTVRTLRRTRTFKILRVGGQITGFEVDEK